MTTVGYGDKTPTTVLGRALGVLWMFLGLGKENKLFIAHR